MFRFNPLSGMLLVGCGSVLFCLFLLLALIGFIVYEIMVVIG